MPSSCQRTNFFHVFVRKITPDTDPFGNLLQNHGPFTGVVARCDGLASQEHLWFETVGLLDAVCAFEIGRLGQYHVGVPGDVAVIDVDGDEQIELVEGLLGQCGVRNRS